MRADNWVILAFSASIVALSTIDIIWNRVVKYGSDDSKEVSKLFIIMSNKCSSEEEISSFIETVNEFYDIYLEVINKTEREKNGLP